MRGYESRVLEYRDRYSIDWACGAGMVIFCRRAAELIHANYAKLAMTMGGIRDFYGDLFGLQLHIADSDEKYSGMLAAPGAPDFGYSPFLYQLGFATLGAIPSMAFDLEFNVRNSVQSDYIPAGRNNAGIARPRIERPVSVG